jgi:hypothetical protein
MMLSLSQKTLSRWTCGATARRGPSTLATPPLLRWPAEEATRVVTNIATLLVSQVRDAWRCMSQMACASEQNQRVHGDACSRCKEKSASCDRPGHGAGCPIGYCPALVPGSRSIDRRGSQRQLCGTRPDCACATTCIAARYILANSDREPQVAVVGRSVLTRICV